jgi:hypothetical protein
VEVVIFSLITKPRGPPTRVMVPWVDANEIFGRAVEHSGASQELRVKLQRVSRPSSDRVVIVSEPMRCELLRIFEAIDAAGLLSSPHLAELRKAANSPIIGT